MKRSFPLFACLLFVAAGCGRFSRSELRYTSHTETRSIAGLPPGARPLTPPITTMDAVTVVGDGAVRTETGPSSQGVPSGAIIVVRADSIMAIDVRDKTYVKQPMPKTDPAGAAKRSASYVHTGEFETISGIRAEQVTFKIEMTVPGSGTSPINSEATGELWLTDRFAQYSAPKPAGAAMDPTESPKGFVMKSIMHIAGNEIETTVTSIKEEPLQPALFEPPPGYTERTLPAAGLPESGSGVGTSPR